MIGMQSGAYEEVDVTSLENIGFRALTKCLRLVVRSDHPPCVMMMLQQAIEILERRTRFGVRS